MSSSIPPDAADLAPLRREGEVEVPMGATLDSSNQELPSLPVYATTLGLNDLDSLVNLESATFPENQRCTREKFVYRLGAAGELCLGLFTSADPGSEESTAPTAPSANSPDATNPERKGILLAHIIATKTANTTIADEDMAIGGHNEAGRTIAVHSLAVLPAYQRRGFGSLLLKEFCQRVAMAEVADAVTLITYDRLIPYYEKQGFDFMGKSESKFGGEEWNNMVLDLVALQQQLHDLEYEEEVEEVYDELEVQDK